MLPPPVAGGGGVVTPPPSVLPPVLPPVVPPVEPVTPPPPELPPPAPPADACRPAISCWRVASCPEKSCDDCGQLPLASGADPSAHVPVPVLPVVLAAAVFLRDRYSRYAPPTRAIPRTISSWVCVIPAILRPLPFGAAGRAAGCSLTPVTRRNWMWGASSPTSAGP